MATWLYEEQSYKGITALVKTDGAKKEFMQTVTPRDLFFDQLLDLHSVETQLVASLPTLLAREPYEPLVALLVSHAEETKRHLNIIASILQAHRIEIGDDKCKAMEGLIAGGDAHLDGVDVPETRDLMMIAHCLRIEHYEVAAYGITLRLAEQLGFREEVALLSATLKEEKEAVVKLSKLEPAIFERALPRVTL
jgi:ferritin-like metal-binding protein YciE